MWACHPDEGATAHHRLREEEPTPGTPAGTGGAGESWGRGGEDTKELGGWVGGGCFLGVMLGHRGSP